MSSGNAFSHSRIAILDFGSQYTQVIARRVREAAFTQKFMPHHAFGQAPKRFVGIILQAALQVYFLSAAPQLDPGDFFACGFRFLASAIASNSWPFILVARLNVPIAANMALGALRSSANLISSKVAA